MEEIFCQEPLWGEGGNLIGALEALFSASGEILSMERLRELTGLGEGAVRQGVEALQERYKSPKGMRLLEVGGGWRMAIAPEYTDLVTKLVTTLRRGRLTPVQREILALVAYRQPITVPEINELRRVTSASHQVKSLLDRELIMPVGRKHVVGRPMMYATTPDFLLRFGLRGLHDLPKLADFGENNLEAQALAQLEMTFPEGGLFSGESVNDG
jgi:segregation and condensation protein B